MKPLIIYVDDDDDDRQTMQDSFAGVEQVELYTLGTGRELLDWMNVRENVDPALIVLDINMPAINGIELLQRIRGNASSERLKVMMFSTSSNPTEVAQCEQYRAKLLIKPNSPEGYNEIVRELVNVASCYKAA